MERLSGRESWEHARTHQEDGCSTARTVFWYGESRFLPALVSNDKKFLPRVTMTFPRTGEEKKGVPATLHQWKPCGRQKLATTRSVHFHSSGALGSCAEASA